MARHVLTGCDVTGSLVLQQRDKVANGSHLDCSVNHVASECCSHSSCVSVHSGNQASTALPLRTAHPVIQAEGCHGLSML